MYPTDCLAVWREGEPTCGTAQLDAEYAMAPKYELELEFKGRFVRSRDPHNVWITNPVEWFLASVN
jgi:hypothetical protein